MYPPAIERLVSNNETNHSHELAVLQRAIQRNRELVHRYVEGLLHSVAANQNLVKCMREGLRLPTI